MSDFRWRPFPPGDANPNSKLTQPQRKTIRELRESGATVRSLARDYGVNPSTISRIVKEGEDKK